MAKLDRLVWAAGFAVRAFGLRIGVRVDHEGVLSRASGLLPPGAVRMDDPAEVDHLFSVVSGPEDGTGRRRRGGRRYALLYGDGTRLVRTVNAAELWSAYGDELEALVASSSPTHRFVHAGAVVWRERAIVLPGPSWAGKTTLTRALVERGAALLSDEYAVLDARGRVHPWPRPFAVKEGGSTRRLPAEEMGAVAELAAPLGAVVVTRYRRGAAFEPRELGPGRAVRELLRQAVSSRVRAAEDLEELAEAVEAIPAWSSVRGEAAEAADGILALLEP